MAALSCLALAASACSQKLTFGSAQASFQVFSECSVLEDIPVRRIKLKEAWLQNVVAMQSRADRNAQAAARRPASGVPPAASTGSTPSNRAPDEEYEMTGIVRAEVDYGPPRDDFTVLLVRKALDKYKVVNWATNVGRKQEERKPLPALLGELHSNPYRGRCPW